MDHFAFFYPSDVLECRVRCQMYFTPHVFLRTEQSGMHMNYADVPYRTHTHTHSVDGGRVAL